ncbi:MAG: AAA family ATPase [Deltaproteobacteria bacterium]|nr:AAA family ATPase [Deltaproteobacteria bacterium]
MGQSVRVPPNSVEMEQALLGSILLNPDVRTKIKPLITPEDFYRESHAAIYQAAIESENGDALVICEDLRRQGRLDMVGGQEYVLNLAMAVHTSAAIEYYGKQVVELSRQRQLFHTFESAALDALDMQKDPDTIMDEVRYKLREMNRKLETTQTNLELVQEIHNDIEERAKNGQQTVGALCGIEAIDSHLFGLEPKTLLYIAGRPSIGKTAIALNMAQNMAKDGEVKHILFFSLEMSAEAVIRRMLASESGVYLSRIRSGNLAEYQSPLLIKAMNVLADINLTILGHPKYKKIEHLTAVAEKAEGEHDGLGAIFVDHIQLMSSMGKFQNRHLEISHISNELKSMAKALNVPVVVLCQLSREVEKQPGMKKKPRLEHLKESGDLEQDADVVIGLYREDHESEIMELGGLKGRDVGTWKSEVCFDRFTQKIS